MRRAPTRNGRRKIQVLSYVHCMIAEHGHAPSYDMICNALGIGTRVEVSRIVQRLERDGKLRRTGAGKVRRIHLQKFA